MPLRVIFRIIPVLGNGSRLWQAGGDAKIGFTARQELFAPRALKRFVSRGMRDYKAIAIRVLRVLSLSIRKLRDLA